MARRYLALVRPAADHARRVRVEAEALGLAVRIDRPDLLLLADAGLPAVPVEGGMILGSVFAPGVADRIAAWRGETARAIVAGRGTLLIHAYWGGYIAFLPGADRIDVVRAPLGELPCLLARGASGDALASDPALLQLAGGPPQRPDWTQVARFLGEPDARSSETCLDGVRELRGGDRLTLDASGTSFETMWTPWASCGQDRRLDDPGEAIARVRDGVRSVVGHRQRDAGRPLLMLSGGLDSSVIAAGLRHHAGDFGLMTLVTENSTGDERDFARQVADGVGRPLDERRRRLDQVELTRSASAHLPRPHARAFEQDSLALAVAALEEFGGDAIFDGGGGDNIFCSLQSASPVADTLLAGHGWAEVLALARQIAAMTGASVGKVVWRGWRRSRRSPAYPWRPDLSFLGIDAIEAICSGRAHPWLFAPAGALPGKAAHVALLVGAQALAEDGDPLASTPTCSPLIAQPLIETCLRVPSWLWYARGRNRAVARQAFAADLPATIAWRRSKGTPDSFVVALFEAKRETIRSMLLDGLLAEHGLLDRAAVAAATESDRPAIGHDFARVMRLVDVESWLRAQSG